MTEPVECLLSIVFPVALEENLIDHLLEHPEWASGFTCVDVEGRGQAVPLHGAAEKVKGRSRRRMVQIALSRAQAQALVEHFRAELPHPEVAYWVVPLLEFGRFA